MDNLPPSLIKPDVAEQSAAMPPLPVLGGAGIVGLEKQAWSQEYRTFPLTLKRGRQAWNDTISEFRAGNLMVGAEGMTITGKATLPAQTKTWILLASILLRTRAET